MALPINEIFTTIQGEATYAGTPATFVRLQGCAVGCGWCDTKYTWVVDDKNKIDTVDLISKSSDSPQWSTMTELDILQEVKKRQPKHIVITGGEPFENNIFYLTCLLINNGYTVQVETSGTKPINAHDDAFITLSPKWDMAGGLTVIDDNYLRANEIKVPVGKQSDITKISTMIPANYLDKSKPLWLQPLSQSKKATEICVAAAIMHSYKISVQTHKYVGVR